MEDVASRSVQLVYLSHIQHIKHGGQHLLLFGNGDFVVSARSGCSLNPRRHPDTLDPRLRRK